MRSVFACFALILAFSLPAQAQIPKVSLYADPVGVTCNITDQSPGTIRLYVVVTDAPGTVTAARFAAPIPACMTGVTWVSDEFVFPVTIGNSQDGITVGTGYCAPTPVHVLTIDYVGQGLSQTCCHYPLVPDPSELEGQIVVVDCDFEMVLGATLDLIVNGDVSCACGQRPAPPSDPSPSDGATDQPQDLLLSWNCSDPQGQSLVYDVYFGTSTYPPLLAGSQPTNAYHLSSLEPGTDYFWRIVARDTDGNQTSGAEWRFGTAVGIEVRPDQPSNPSPPLASTGQPLTLTLSWDCSDPQGDPLTYDIFFGDATLPLVASDHPTNSYDVTFLSQDKEYFWRIRAKDNQGHDRWGETWWFKTVDERPDSPHDPSPANFSTVHTEDVTLTWQCTDPQGDPLTYDVYFGSSATPPLVSSDNPTNSYDVGLLAWNHTYYWRIVAKDNHGNEVTGSIWWFYVAAVGNPPLPPSNPSPPYGSTEQPLDVTLMWTCSDPNGDPLTYDVYMGLHSPLSLVASDHTTNSFSISQLLNETTYLWRIVAKDGNGNSTSGPTWFFETARIGPYNPTAPSPPNEAVDQSLVPTLAWACSHPSDLPMTYDIYFGTVNPPPRLTVAWPNKSFNVGPLSPQTKYYWRIRALDTEGYWAWGTLWDFTTLDAPLGTPWAPNPPTGALNQPLSLTLSWQCTASGGDTFTYDVYFGASSEPPLVSSNLTTNHYTVNSLDVSTVYYWKIVARDEQNNEKTGPLWMFETQGLGPPRVVVNTITDYCALEPSSTVTVTVSIVNNATAIDAAGVDITYDPAVLTFQSCVAGDLTSSWQQFAHTNQGTTIRVGGYNVTPIPQGSVGTFAVLTFVSECCNLPEPASFQMCPVNLTDDLSSMAPACGSYTCDFVTFTQDGDVNWDGKTTPADAFCAFEGYLSEPDDPEGECGAPGWNIRADVDCSDEVTPSDATCIYDQWLDGSCAFCGEEAALAARRSPSGLSPVVSVGALACEGNEIGLPIRASGVPGMRAFGFEMTYPASLEYIGIAKTSDTNGFVAIDARVVGDGRLRVGGYSHDPLAGGDADILVLRFGKTPTSTGGTLVIQKFVDDLEGAAAVRYSLPSEGNETPAATQYSLDQNRPNPFNPTTTIRYEIPAGVASVHVRLDVYDVQGHKVRGLVDEVRSAGAQYAEWNGLDDEGRAVSSGVYFYVLRAGDETLTRKMALLR